MKRLFCFDMDGTLLASDHSLPFTHEQALAELVRQQQPVVIATGRAYAGVCAVLANKPWFAQLTCVIHNGGATFTHGKPESIHAMSWQGLSELVAVCRQLNIHFHYQSAEKTYVSDPDRRWQWVYDLHQLNPIAIEQEKPFDEPLVKICLMAEPNQLHQLDQHYSDLPFIVQNQWTHSGHYFVDITAPGVTKQNAMARLANQWGYLPEQVVAFGDQDNDAALLAWAGLSFAMANGSEAARQAATHLAPISDQGGVAQCLQQHHLL